MACTLYFIDDRITGSIYVMTSSWTATAADDKVTTVTYLQDHYNFTKDFDLPFSAFANYIQDCQRDGSVASLTEETIPEIIQKYSTAAPAPVVSAKRDFAPS